MTDIRISIRNGADLGGTYLTPFAYAFHDGSVDIATFGAQASAGLEQLAEDGDASGLFSEILSNDADAQTGTLGGVGGPLAPSERAVTTLDVDENNNRLFSLAAMVLPSNDAFIVTLDPRDLFDPSGVFVGAQTISFLGSDVFDAGTEENTELEAAFINQTAPDTGTTENGLINVHPGFIDSAGNPGGTPVILGGRNDLGIEIDPIAADFTRPGFEIAEVHLNTLLTTAGTAARDVLKGTATDDLANGGAGKDVLIGNDGFDFLDGGAERDLLFGGNGDDNLIGQEGNDRISGGAGSDSISGGAGSDRIEGGDGDDNIRGGAGKDLIEGAAGDDNLFGGDGRDFLRGGDGDDRLNGGIGNDVMSGGIGADTFFFRTGDGRDRIDDFDPTSDVVSLANSNFATFADAFAAARQVGDHIRIDYTDTDFIVLRDLLVDQLVPTNFDFIVLG